MAVGQGSLVSNLSYLAFARETTYGTYVTATAGLNFISAGFKLTKEVKILEEIQTSRTNSNFIGLGRNLEGNVEFYFNPRSAAANYLLHNAFGASTANITTATATGETAGGLAFTHTVDIGNFDATYSSLSVNHRKGDSLTGKIFEYIGLRANEITFMGELDEALKTSVSLIGKDATTSSNDVSSSINTLTQVPLSFVNGRVSIESSTSFTTTSFWHVQSFELKVSNNLNADTGSRRIGSDTLDVLPAGMAQIDFKCTLRYDTLTAYNAMIAGTRLAAQIEFQGDTMSTSVIREGVKFTLPYIVVTDAGDPEIGGPNDVITQEVTFAVLRDPTASGYALKAEVTNLTASYA